MHKKPNCLGWTDSNSYRLTKNHSWLMVLERQLFPKWLQSHTRYVYAAILNATINARIWYGNSAHVGDKCTVAGSTAAGSYFAFKIAAKPLQTDMVTIDGNSTSAPYPTLPSSTSYDEQFSRNGLPELQNRLRHVETTHTVHKAWPNVRSVGQKSSMTIRTKWPLFLSK